VTQEQLSDALNALQKNARATTPEARLVVRAVSTDYDTVVRAQTYAGGDIYGPYQYGIRQPHWQWGIGGNEPAAEFMRMIRPLMGQRRQKQIDEALAKASDTNN
jgi:hypothetical protein